MKRALVLLLLAFPATSLLAASYALATIPFVTSAIFPIHRDIDRTQNISTHQGIAGNATIANTSPLCSVTGSVPATGPDLIITSSNGKIQVVVLGWTLRDGCALIAPFHVTVSPGVYSLNLSNCSYMGCRVLPITVGVVPGNFTPVNINIVTGIY